MDIDIVTLVDGIVGMLLGGALIAARHECGRVLRERCGIPSRWTMVVAGAVTGSGLSLLLAAVFTAHRALSR